MTIAEKLELSLHATQAINAVSKVDEVAAALDKEHFPLDPAEVGRQEVGVAMKLADVAREFKDLSDEYVKRGHSRA